MIDLSGFKYEEPGLPIPEGEYNCIIRKVTEEIPKNGGEEFAKIHYQIMDGEQKGKFIADNLYLFSDKDSTKFNIAYDKLNWLRKYSGLVDAATLEQFIGVKVGVVVRHNEYNGNLYPNVKRIFEIKPQVSDFTAGETKPFIDDDIPDMGSAARLPF